MKETELEKAEEQLTQTKGSVKDAEATRTTSEGLTRKVALLEEELDASEKNLKDVTEKYVPMLRRPRL